MSEDLEQILSDEQAVEEVEPTEAVEAGAEDTGTPPEEEKPGPSIAELQAQLDELRKEASGLKYALTDERQKRQLYEARQKPQDGLELPDPLDDPKGYAKALEQHYSQQFTSAMLQERINMSRAIAANAHADYAEKEQRFAEIAQQDPRLIDAMKQHPNPAEYAYQIASNSMTARTPEQQRAEEDARVQALVEERIKAVLGSAPAQSDLQSTPRPNDVGESDSLYDILQR